MALGYEEDGGKGESAQNVRNSTISELGSAMAAAMMPLEPNNSNAAKYVNNPLFMC